MTTRHRSAISTTFDMTSSIRSNIASNFPLCNDLAIRCPIADITGLTRSFAIGSSSRDRFGVAFRLSSGLAFRCSSDLSNRLPFGQRLNPIPRLCLSLSWKLGSSFAFGFSSGLAFRCSSGLSSRLAAQAPKRT